MRDYFLITFIVTVEHDQFQILSQFVFKQYWLSELRSRPIEQSCTKDKQTKLVNKNKITNKQR